MKLKSCTYLQLYSIMYFTTSTLKTTCLVLRSWYAYKFSIFFSSKYMKLKSCTYLQLYSMMYSTTSKIAASVIFSVCAWTTMIFLPLMNGRQQYTKFSITRVHCILLFCTPCSLPKWQPPIRFEIFFYQNFFSTWIIA